MSEQPSSNLAPPARPRRGLGLTLFMIAVGLVLMFPGLCSLYYLHSELGVPQGGNEGALTGFFDVWVAICLLIGIGGMALIVRAIWR
jgi:hypothetical protein